MTSDDEEHREQWPKRRNRNENLRVKRTKRTQEEILRDNERRSSSRLSWLRDAQQATIDHERDAETVIIQQEQEAERATIHNEEHAERERVYRQQQRQRE